MQSLSRAALVLLPLGALAGAASRPARAPREMTLLVAATTDVHGHLTGWDYYDNRPDTARGLARAATIVDSIRAVAPARVVLVDAGDMLQGTPLTYVAARRESFAVHISPADYFPRNWWIVSAAAIPPAYAATHHWTP